MEPADPAALDAVVPASPRFDKYAAPSTASPHARSSPPGSRRGRPGTPTRSVRKQEADGGSGPRSEAAHPLPAQTPGAEGRGPRPRRGDVHCVQGLRAHRHPRDRPRDVQDRPPLTPDLRLSRPPHGVVDEVGERVYAAQVGAGLHQRVSAWAWRVCSRRALLGDLVDVRLDRLADPHLVPRRSAETPAFTSRVAGRLTRGYIAVSQGRVGGGGAVRGGRRRVDPGRQGGFPGVRGNRSTSRFGPRHWVCPPRVAQGGDGPHRKGDGRHVEQRTRGGTGRSALTKAAGMVAEAKADFDGFSRKLDGQIAGLKGKWAGAGGTAFFTLHQAWTEKQNVITKRAQRLRGLPQSAPRRTTLTPTTPSPPTTPARPPASADRATQDREQ